MSHRRLPDFDAPNNRDSLFLDVSENSRSSKNPPPHAPPHAPRVDPAPLGQTTARRQYQPYRPPPRSSSSYDDPGTAGSSTLNTDSQPSEQALAHYRQRGGPPPSERGPAAHGSVNVSRSYSTGTVQGQYDYGHQRRQPRRHDIHRTSSASVASHGYYETQEPIHAAKTPQPTMESPPQVQPPRAPWPYPPRPRSPSLLRQMGRAVRRTFSSSGKPRSDLSQTNHRGQPTAAARRQDRYGLVDAYTQVIGYDADEGKEYTAPRHPKPSE
ncbi:hypothetical protein BJ170DRAFT_678643 [Xylariales sp. AK1849]|nr:hypothetical protein BJ170DRAFT_678643 [Xylariales sp. AK1849]